MIRLSLLTLSLAVMLNGCTLTTSFEGECQVDQDCLSKGWSLYCESNLCVSSTEDQLVDGEKCHRIYPEGFDRERGILIGSLLPITGALSTRGPSRERAVYLAVDEINQAGGIGGRPLGVLSCDSGTDPVVGEAAARHLVEAGHVAAVVGPCSSGVSTHVFTEVFHAAGVLVVSPSATAPSLTNLPDSGLFWRTAPSDAFQGAAIAAHLHSSGVTRIAVINRDDAYGNGLKSVVEEYLCLTEEDCSDARYFARSYRIDSATASATDQSTIIPALEDFAPEIIVLIGLLDDGWTFLNILDSETTLTHFIVSDGMKNAKLFELNNAEIKTNLLGTAPAAPAGENYNQFNLRYKAKYNGETPGSYTAQSYDALYTIAYALGAHAPEQRPTGASLALQMRRLIGGESFSVGESNFNAIIEVLRSNPDAIVNINGASGPLDFDLERGEAPADIEAWMLDTIKQEIMSIGVLFSAEGIYTPINSD